MAGSSLPSSLLTQGGPSLLFSSSNQVSEAKCQLVVTPGKRSLVRCLAKKKISFVDQILDYIEGIFNFLCFMFTFHVSMTFESVWSVCFKAVLSLGNGMERLSFCQRMDHQVEKTMKQRNKKKTLLMETKTLFL